MLKHANSYYNSLLFSIVPHARQALASPRQYMLIVVSPQVTCSQQVVGNIMLVCHRHHFIPGLVSTCVLVWILVELAFASLVSWIPPLGSQFMLACRFIDHTCFRFRFKGSLRLGFLSDIEPLSKLVVALYLCNCAW